LASSGKNFSGRNNQESLQKAIAFQGLHAPGLLKRKLRKRINVRLTWRQVIVAALLVGLGRIVLENLSPSPTFPSSRSGVAD
jgi:hypothetical protein